MNETTVIAFREKNLITRVFIPLSFLLAFQAYGENESEKQAAVTFGTETDAVYQYIWRGISYNRGLLAQPSAWLTRGNFTVSTWCNYTIFDVNKAVKQHEVDLVGQYDQTIGGFTIEPSINLYLYPNQTNAPTTGELALNIGYSKNDWAFSTTQYVDFMEYNGAYFGEAGLTYTKTTFSKNLFSFGFILGWGSKKFNEVYSGLAQSTLSNLVFNCSYELGLTESLYLRPHIEIYHNINSSLQKINHANLINFGLIIGFGA